MNDVMATKWVMFATKLPYEKIVALSLTYGQLTVLGQAISENPLLNPPKERKVKTGQFACKWCSQTFFATYTTKHPTSCGACRLRIK